MPAKLNALQQYAQPLPFYLGTLTLPPEPPSGGGLASAVHNNSTHHTFRRRTLDCGFLELRTTNKSLVCWSPLQTTNTQIQNTGLGTEMWPYVNGAGLIAMSELQMTI